MWKWFIGPALLGAGWLAGSVYGADARQVVHKDPDTVYAAVERSFDNMPPSGTTFFEGGARIPYELKVDRTPEQRLTVTLWFAGRQGATADIQFTPQDNGAATLITAKLHGDHGVLRQALAGTDKAKLAYAPDWMLNLTARPVLQQLAAQIEKGDGDAGVPGYQSEADWEASLPPDQQNQMQAWRQYDASRPTTDPDADARAYMNGGSSGN
jgi:hypothetical protein